MSPKEELRLIKKNVHRTKDPELLFAQNQRARQLEEEIRYIEMSWTT